MQIDFSKEGYNTFLEIPEIVQGVLLAHRTDELEGRYRRCPGVLLGAFVRRTTPDYAFM
ncbi:MAG: hypothetical protein H8D56_06305 [Planctomycetes bacterium]|nr:hypothetical protein [Planctomycetota bacterium]MBL7143334.1 hypothetical protein [Phycisphaerae bacterium]